MRIKASDGKRAELKVENGTIGVAPYYQTGTKSRYSLMNSFRKTRDNVQHVCLGCTARDDA